ncbi:MAG: ATP-binding cassette domain-containing protein, partial [Bacteroidota bacterium]|nr:ATP-binding cassette domain-containing protein [Bacteroidota bacterium]
MSIKIESVTKYYGNQKALDNLSFEVNKGELIGFLGPNGAGKSTLMKIITGYLPASSGKIFIDDAEVTIDNPEIRRKVG